LLACSGDLPAAVALGHPKTLPAKSRFLALKQKADNAGGNEEENSPDHHAAHSAEQHDDEVGLTKQHPAVTAPIKPLTMQVTEKPRESQMSPLSLMFVALLLAVIVQHWHGS